MKKITLFFVAPNSFILRFEIQTEFNKTIYAHVMSKKVVNHLIITAVKAEYTCSQIAGKTSIFLCASAFHPVQLFNSLKTKTLGPKWRFEKTVFVLPCERGESGD